MFNLKATITLDVDGYTDTDLASALDSFKADLETRFDSACKNIVVVTEEQ